MTTLGPPPRVHAADDEAEAVPADGALRTALLPRRDAPGRSGSGDAAGSGTGPRGLREWAARWLRHPVVAAVLFGSVLHLLWLWLIANGGGDLAAQDAWAEFVGQHPLSAYNLAWYGGMHPVSYSIASPYLMAVVGVRPVLILSGVLSGGLLALLLMRSGAVRHPMVPSLWGAFAFACNAASGRVTYALGTLFALGAVAVVWAWPAHRGTPAWRRGALVLVLSALATAGSPVAGLFLEVLAAALLLQRRWRPALALGLPLPLVVGLSALLFPFQGVQPMPWPSIVFPLVITIAVLLLTPREWRTVRQGSLIYLCGVLLTWCIPSQVGSNVERLAQIFGPVVLLALLPRFRTGERGTRGRRWTALVCAFVVAAGFQVGKPAYDVLHTRPEAAWAHDLAPLLHRLQQVDADQGRVEVVPVRSHREASALAPYVNLARGWNRQADAERNPLFYEEGGFTAERYHAWLRRWAVRYVVLPLADTPDVAAQQEARLVHSEPPFLDLVWEDTNWQLYRVADPLPLASAPAVSAHAGAGEVTVEVRKPGAVLVRIPWSPWLGLVNGQGDRIAPPRAGGPNVNGCLRQADPRPARPPVNRTAPGGEDTRAYPPPVPGMPGGDAPKRPFDGDGQAADESGPLGILSSEEYDEARTDQWTVLEAPRAGTYRLAAPYRLPRGTPCPLTEDARDGSGS